MNLVFLFFSLLGPVAGFKLTLSGLLVEVFTNVVLLLAIYEYFYWLALTYNRLSCRTFNWDDSFGISADHFLALKRNQWGLATKSTKH
jgi:hypothetical protein